MAAIIPTEQSLLLKRLEGCLQSAVTAGDSCPHLFDEAQDILCDLIVRVRAMRTERDSRKATKARGDLMDREELVKSRADLEDYLPQED